MIYLKRRRAQMVFDASLRRRKLAKVPKFKGKEEDDNVPHSTVCHPLVTATEGRSCVCAGLRFAEPCDRPL